MKKWLFALLLTGFGFLNAWADGATAAGAGATLQALGNGKYLLTVQPGQGWPQARFPVPAPTGWGKSQVAMTVKLVDPASGKFNTGITVGSDIPRNAIAGRYIHSDLIPGRATAFRFPQTGDTTPRFIAVAVKNPKIPISLEISNLDFGGAEAAPPAAVTPAAKKRLAPLPAIRFQGKPFFPLGVYDSFRYNEAGNFTSLDPDFIAAGGNFCDFGQLYLPSEQTNEVYKKVYQTHGQPAIFAALDQIRDDPAWRHVALLVGLGGNLMLDESETTAVGMNNMLKPAAGAALELRKKTLAEAAAKLSTYPNVIGYTMDEPENCVWKYYDANCKEGWARNKDLDLADRINEWLGWVVPVIRANHPGAQLMPIMGWWTTYEKTAPLYDVLIANTYPAKKPGMKEFDADLFTVNYDAACQVKAVRAAGGSRSAIFMPPAFDVLPNTIPLTLNEQLYVMFAPITRGVMGIHAWRLQRCSDAHRKFVIYPALKEVSKLTDFLLGEWCDELISSDRDTASIDYLKKFQERIRLVEGLEDAAVVEVRDAVPDVSYCLRKNADGRYLLLAVNNRREPLEANFTFELPVMPRVMTDNINRSYRVWTKGKTAKVAFPPFGVRALIFQP